MLKRTGVLLYGVISYSLFFISYLYAIGFVGNIAVPRSIDSEAVVPLGTALIVNVVLLGVFAIQHSVMARPAFKKWFTRIVPQHIERSTYVLISSVLLIALFVFWQPMGGVVWQVNDPVGQAALYTAFGMGWLIVLIATFLINHLTFLDCARSGFIFAASPIPR